MVTRFMSGLVGNWASNVVRRMCGDVTLGMCKLQKILSSLLAMIPAPDSFLGFLQKNDLSYKNNSNNLADWCHLLLKLHIIFNLLLCLFSLGNCTFPHLFRGESVLLSFLLEI